MRKIAVASLITLVITGAGSAQSSQPQSQTALPPAPQKFPLIQYLTRGQDAAARDLLEAAELMPEEHYGFRATTETKPFGQIVAHIALSRFGTCAALAGKENPHKGEKEEAGRTKAQLVALLKEAATLCTAAREGLTEESLTQMMKVGVAQNEVAKGVFLASDIGHSNEIYGTMAVYLRLKGLVPPSTARAQKARGSQ